MFNASHYIEEFYNHPEFPPTFNISLKNGKPSITHYDKLVSWTYLVEDRIKFEKGWEDYAKIIFPLSVEQCYNIVNKNKQESKIRLAKNTEEQSRKKWIIAVEELLK